MSKIVIIFLLIIIQILKIWDFMNTGLELNQSYKEIENKWIKNEEKEQ